MISLNASKHSLSCRQGDFGFQYCLCLMDHLLVDINSEIYLVITFRFHAMVRLPTEYIVMGSIY